MLVARVDRQRHAFVLRMADIDRLLGLIRPYFPTGTVQVSCADGLIRTFENRHEFNAFQNSKRSAITELRISAKNSEDHSFGVIFNDDDRSNVRITLSANDVVATAVNEIYEDFLTGIQPWYRRIATADWTFLILSAGFLIGCMVLATAMMRGGRMPRLDDFQLKHFIIGIPAGLVPVVLATFLRKLRRRFFPMGAFAIGDGARRQENDEIWRTVFIAGFVVSVLSSVALSWFI